MPISRRPNIIRSLVVLVRCRPNFGTTVFVIRNQIMTLHCYKPSEKWWQHPMFHSFYHLDYLTKHPVLDWESSCTETLNRACGTVAITETTILVPSRLCEVTQHYDDVIMGTMASQMTSLTFVYSTVYSGADQRKHQSSASLVFVRGIHRGPVNSPHKWPVTRKMFPFDDVIMNSFEDRIPVDFI